MMTGSSFGGIFRASPTGVDAAADIVLLGAPHDAGSSYRPGARLAPQAIREMATSLNPATERGDDLTVLDAVDAGDLVLPSSSPEAWARIEDAVRRVVQRGKIPFVLGGDHTVTVPSFSAVWKHRGDARLLVLDAHPDLYPDYRGDRYSHACVTRRLLELEGFDGTGVTQVGIRASNPVQNAAARDAGIRMVHAWEVDEFVYEPSGPVWLSIDIDVLDPAHAPGCGNPVPGGLTTRQLLDLIRGLGGVELLGVDLVEVNPMLDAAGITALAAVRVVTETLGLLAGGGR